MYSVKKYRGGFRSYPRNLLNSYRYVYFGTMAGKNIAIVSRRELIFTGRDRLNVVEEVKLPLYKVDLNMRMGRGYHPTERTSRVFNFVVSEEYNERLLYEVYELV